MQKSDHRQILKQIRRIRESHPEMVKIFTQGSCLHFFLILRSFYPQAEAWLDSDHVVTKIGDRMYDITGEVKEGEYFPSTEYVISSSRRKIINDLQSERSKI